MHILCVELAFDWLNASQLSCLLNYTKNISIVEQRKITSTTLLKRFQFLPEALEHCAQGIFLSTASAVDLVAVRALGNCDMHCISYLDVKNKT